MIIAKPQQFIIFDCGQDNLTLNSLPAEIKNKIFKIFRVQQPVGSTFQAYVPDNVFGSQFSRLESNGLYLVFTKPGQLGYEIPGAVDPDSYCKPEVLSNNILSDGGWSLDTSDFFDTNSDVYYSDLKKKNNSSSGL